MNALQVGDRVRVLASTFVPSRLTRELIGVTCEVQAVQVDERHLITVSGWIFNRSDVEALPAEATA